MVGPASIAIIATVAVIIFGPKKLPELGRAMGSTLREFKSATKGLTDDDFDSTKKEAEKAKEPVKVVETVQEPTKELEQEKVVEAVKNPDEQSAEKSERNN